MTENITRVADLSPEALAKAREFDAQTSPAPAAVEPAFESTRDRSPRKPTDLAPALKDKLSVEFAGETYEFDVRAAKDSRTMFALYANDFQAVLTRVVGEDGLERAVTSLEDEDGYSDFEKLSEFVKVIFEKAGSKNS